jgi:ribosomal protein L44E
VRFIKSQDFLCKPCNHAVNLKVLEIKKFKTEALVLDENRFVERRVSEIINSKTKLYIQTCCPFHN